MKKINNIDNFSKYNEKDIHNILIDMYYFRSLVDVDVIEKNTIELQTTIEEWIRIIAFKNLVAAFEYVIYIFELDKVGINSINIVTNAKLVTIGDLCNFIAINAVRGNIFLAPYTADKCFEGAIFRYIRRELKEKNIDSTDFTPSRPFVPFFDKNSEMIAIIISKTAPGSIRQYKYENTFEGTVKFIIIITLILILLSIIELSVDFIYKLINIILIIFTVLFFRPKKNTFKIENYSTVRDLVLGMKNKLTAEWDVGEKPL